MLSNRLNTILGIEIRFLADHLYSCRSCVLKRNGNVLDIGVRKILEGSLVQVLESLPRNYPTALVFTGKGIVNKTIKTSQIQNDYFQQAFPSIEKSEFYCQQYEGEEMAIISITRKQIIDSLLVSLELAGFNILGLSLGGVVATQILRQLKLETNEIVFDGHHLNLTDNGSLMAYSDQVDLSTFKKISIAGEEVDERTIISYAVAFQLMMIENTEPILADVETVNQHRVSFVSDSAIKKKAMLFLALLFFALLTNFLLFAYYNDANANLAVQVGSITSSGDRAELLKKNIAENQFLLEEMGWNGGYSYGYLADQIGKSMPKRLALFEIAFNSNPTEHEKLSNTPNIKIIGNSDNLIAVNNWIYILKEKPWVKKVSLLKYEEDNEHETFRFNLKIEY